MEVQKSHLPYYKREETTDGTGEEAVGMWDFSPKQLRMDM
jgi:hypothetical protein